MDDPENPDVSGELFKQLTELTDREDVRDTIPAISGVLVRELTNAIALYNMAPDLADRVLRLVAEDVRAALEDWQAQRRH